MFFLVPGMAFLQQLRNFTTTYSLPRTKPTRICTVGKRQQTISTLGSFYGFLCRFDYTFFFLFFFQAPPLLSLYPTLTRKIYPSLLISYFLNWFLASLIATLLTLFSLLYLTYFMIGCWTQKRGY